LRSNAVNCIALELSIKNFSFIYVQGDSGLVQQQKKILIIDDNEDITMSLRVILERYGFKTDSYSDSVLANKNFRNGQYDLVILDIKMPVYDGFHSYQKIRKIDSKVKVCFLTATEYFHEEIRKEHGLDELNKELFLRKPIETEELVREIRKLLEAGYMGAYLLASKAIGVE
jgi:DNA-binding response OmpR family regulator